MKRRCGRWTAEKQLGAPSSRWLFSRKFDWVVQVIPQHAMKQGHTDTLKSKNKDRAGWDSTFYYGVRSLRRCAVCGVQRRAPSSEEPFYLVQSPPAAPARSSSQQPVSSVGRSTGCSQRSTAWYCQLPVAQQPARSAISHQQPLASRQARGQQPAGTESREVEGQLIPKIAGGRTQYRVLPPSCFEF